MSVFIIDTETTSLYYDQITQLEGVQYVFTFIWSDRESCWYLNISDQNENQLASGIRIVVDFSLLAQFINPSLPPGILAAVDLTGNNQDIQVPTDLGQGILLMYTTSDDPLLPANQ